MKDSKIYVNSVHFFILYNFSADSASNYSPRIVGGQRAQIEDFKWQAALLVDSNFFCGGCIISSTKILSAAHCVRFLGQGDQLQARVGSASLLDGGVLKKIVNVHSHPDYNWPSRGNNDIAVFFLDEPLVFDATVGAIPLARSDLSLSPGEPVTVSGFGAKSQYSRQQDYLYSVSVPIVDYDQCQKAYKDYYGFDKINKSMICAGYYGVGGKDACKGDSGGR